MRTLLKISMDVDAANRAIDQGLMQQIVGSLNELIKPEAAYFTTDRGKRTAYYFFDLKDPSLIPAIAEPLFHHLRAEIDLKPVMNREDLMKGLGETGKEKKAAA